MNSNSGEKRVRNTTLTCRQGIKNLTLAAALALLLTGCFGGGQPGRMVEQYALEYQPEAPQEFSMLPESITVERFTSARQYSTTAMVYQEEPYRRNHYLYHRWRVNPADLVTDYLLRDLRSAGMFRGVFNHRSSEPSRYLLAGDVEEFREYEDEEGRWAEVSLSATLLDSARQEMPDRLLFQKNYRAAEQIEGKNGAGLAQGISRAMAKVSALMMGDIFRTVQTKREKEGK